MKQRRLIPVKLIWSLISCGLYLLIHTSLTAQSASPAPSVSKQTVQVKAPEVDRAALRQEAKKRHAAERVFDETQGPTNPYLRMDFPPMF